jgi:hypothetical protein
MTTPADTTAITLPGKGKGVLARDMSGTGAGPWMPVSEPAKTTSIASLADVAVSTSPASLPALPAGPSGILVTAHPANGSTVIRVSGSDVGAAQGQPLIAGASILLSIDDASRLSARTESGTGKLCISAA